MTEQHEWGNKEEYDKAAQIAIEQALGTGNIELTRALRRMVNFTATLKRATEALSAEDAKLLPTSTKARQKQSFSPTPTYWRGNEQQIR